MLGYFAALVIGMMASLPYIIRDLGQFLICHYGKVQDILQSGFTLATPQSPHSKANSQKPLTPFLSGKLRSDSVPKKIA